MNMNSLFLFLILCVLILINDKLNKLLENNKKEKKNMKSYKELLPSYQGKLCEIGLTKYLATLDHLYNNSLNIKARIIDFDDEWVILETYKKEKKYECIVRISNINNIIEINE